MLFAPALSFAEPLPIVAGVEPQPLTAQVHRLTDALKVLGSPLSPDEMSALTEAANLPDAEVATAKIQAVLDPHCLAGVTINPEMRVKVITGPARLELVELVAKGAHLCRGGNGGRQGCLRSRPSGLRPPDHRMHRRLICA
jgi:hypothetical protein